MLVRQKHKTKKKKKENINGFSWSYPPIINETKVKGINPHKRPFNDSTLFCF